MPFIQQEERSLPPGAVRNQEQRDTDRKFLFELLNKEPDIEYKKAHQLLLEEIKSRGDTYVLSYNQITSDIRDIKSGVIRESKLNIKKHIEDTLFEIDEQIKLCVNEIHRRSLDRVKRTKKTTNLRAKDLKALPEDIAELFEDYAEYFYNEEIIEEELAGGEEMKEPMDMLYKWIKAKRELLGIDAPRVTVSKGELLVQHTQGITLESLKKKFNELGGDSNKFQQFIDLITIKNEQHQIPEESRTTKKHKVIKKDDPKRIR